MLYEKLNYVLVIAEEQNLTRAAKRLFISQPTLTLYLNRLEAELEVKLFDRSKTPIILTEAGSYYIEKMKKISASEQLLRNDIRFIENPEQTLIVGIGQVRGSHWLPRILPTFCSIHPQVNIQIVQSTEQYMSEALYTRRMDLALGVLPASVSDLKVVDLIYERLYLAAHRKFGLIPVSEQGQYSADHPYTVPHQKLNGLPFITPQVSNGLYDSYEKIILNNQIKPSRTISVNNLSTGLDLVINGLGVQLLSGSILQFSQYPGKTEELLDICVLEGMPQTRKCVAAYSKDNIKQNLIEDFIRVVKSEVLPNCKHTIVIT